MTRLGDHDDAALMRLVAQVDASDELHLGDWRFFDWLARRERLRAERHARPVTEDEIAARGERLMMRARVRQLSVRSIPGAPPVRAATSIGSAGQVIDLAARERGAPLVSLGVAAGVGRELWDEAVDEWVTLPDEIGDGRHVALRIVGESMAPVMHTGDTVLVRLESDPQVNSIIVARHEDDGYVCKRVWRVLPDRIELASLEVGRPMIVIPRDPSLILGTVLLVWNRAKKASV